VPKSTVETVTAPCEPTKTATTLPAYLTPKDVAQLLQISEKTVSRWHLEDASMPCIKRGKVVRFPREALMAWLARQDASRRTNHAPITQRRAGAA